MLLTKRERFDTSQGPFIALRRRNNHHTNLRHTELHHPFFLAHMLLGLFRSQHVQASARYGPATNSLSFVQNSMDG